MGREEHRVNVCTEDMQGTHQEHLTSSWHEDARCEPPAVPLAPLLGLKATSSSWLRIAGDENERCTAAGRSNTVAVP